MAETLKPAGRLYPCYETEEELDRRRKRRLARGLPPIYDRAALKLDAAEHAKLEAAGQRPHWRFRLLNTEADKPLDPVPTLVDWIDLVRGDQAVDIGSLSDPVLIRADGTPLYTFTSVVDDIDFAVTHVIRGEDHVTNTAVQIQLFEAMGGAVPQFAHHSLLIGADGQALSKRLGALSIESFRDLGLEPMAVNSLAALIGTSDAVVPHTELTDLARYVRSRQAVAGAVALRRGRVEGAQCAAAASASLRRGDRSADGASVWAAAAHFWRPCAAT